MNCFYEKPTQFLIIDTLQLLCYSICAQKAPVAQWLEHDAYNVDVGGSIPPWRTPMKNDSYIVDNEYAGDRLDVFLAAKTGESRSQVQKIIRDGRALVDGKVIKKNGYAVNPGSSVETKEEVLPKNEAPKKKNQLVPSDKKLEVITETDTYIVVNKPAGLLTHPTQAGEPDTLAGRLIHTYPDLAGVGEDEMRPGIVHRLDKDASGLLVVARTQEMFEHLKEQFKSRTVEKEYTTLVYGKLDTDHGTIDFDIDRGNDGRMVARPKTEVKLKNVSKLQPAKQALTEFWPEEFYPRYTLLRVKIHTGRMHQIRVHLFAYNHPVVGDTLYENKNLIKKGDSHLGRLFLHASHLCFAALDGEKVCFDAGLPNKLKTFLASL